MNQKYITGFMMVLLTLFPAFVGVATAESTNYLFDQETIITGMVAQDGDSFILLVSDGDQYTMTGQDLSELVGKKVQATGELIIDQDENRLNLNEIVEVRNVKLGIISVPVEKKDP